MKTVAGLDVHKDSVYLCILREKGEKIERVYGVLTPQLDSMRNFMTENEVSEVAMESTSVYWIPIWRVLVDSFELKLVNPYFIRQLPGRKSDVKDAQWQSLTRLVQTQMHFRVQNISYLGAVSIQGMTRVTRKSNRTRLLTGIDSSE